MRKCATCGRVLAEEDYECRVCRKDWSRARRAPGFLPTVELFPEMPTAEPARQEATQADLFMEE